MAQVTVMIDGKAYRMACEEGQEDHLTELATRFDQYVSHLKTQFGEIGDLRLTVMAGIMVMDELSEVNRKLKNIQAETDALKQGRVATLSDQQKERGCARDGACRSHNPDPRDRRQAQRQDDACAALNFNKFSACHWRKPSMHSILTLRSAPPDRTPQSLGPYSIQRELSLTWPVG